MNYSGMLIKMFIFAVLLTIGYIAAKKGILGSEFSKSTSWILVNVYIASSIFNSVLGDRPKLPERELWMALFMLSVTVLLLYIFGLVAARLFGNDGNLPQRLILMAVVNNLFVGLPVLQALCGSEAVFYMGLSCVPYNLILYSFGAWMLRRGKGNGSFSIKAFFTPSLVAASLALIVFVAKIQMPVLVTDFFGTVSAATVPVSMILIGATIGSGSLSDAFRNRKILFLSLIKLVAVPVIAYMMLRYMTDNRTLLISCVVMAACPSGILCTPLSVQYGYDPFESSGTVMVSTLLSIITIPALVYFLF